MTQPMRRRRDRRAPRPDHDPDARRYYIYRLYDSAGDLLYIGRSCDPLGRVRGHHATGAEWAKRIVEVRAWGGRFTWDEAVRLERAAILSERPPHNIDGVAKKTGVADQGTGMSALEPSAEKDVPANYYAPDGYRYGVMFSDGSVAERWSGRTQREQAQHEANQSAAIFPHSNITLARRLPGEPWTRVLPPGEGKRE